MPNLLTLLNEMTLCVCVSWIEPMTKEGHQEHIVCCLGENPTCSLLSAPSFISPYLLPCLGKEDDEVGAAQAVTERAT